LAEIQSLAPKEESRWTRKVVKYCAEALVRRAYGIRPPCTFPSLPLLSEPIEYIYDGFATITSKRLHIIDFSIMFDFWWWIYLIDDLKEQYGGLQSVLITSIAPKLSKHSAYLRPNRKWVRKVEDKNLELILPVVEVVGQSTKRMFFYKH
jgi:DELLA protein